jgi:hypothetical protein
MMLVTGDRYIFVSARTPGRPRDRGKWPRLRLMPSTLDNTVPFYICSGSATLKCLVRLWNSGLRERAIADWLSAMMLVTGDRYNAGEIGLQYVPTEEQAADGLTKPLGPTAFAKFCRCSLIMEFHVEMSGPFVELGITREGNSGLVVSHDDICSGSAPS